jgi:hypothetical protein
MSTNAPNNAHGTGNLHIVNGDYSGSPKEFLLALQLKQNNEFVDTDSTDGMTMISYVVSFNDSFLRKKCMKSSTHYNPKIDLILLVRHTFPPNEWWTNRALLLDAVKHVSKLLGFCAILKCNNIQCNCYGKQEYAQSYESGPLLVECTFNLNIKAFYNPKSKPKTIITNGPNGLETKQVKAITHPDRTNLTSIVSKDSINGSCPNCYSHGGGCFHHHVVFL